MKGAYTKTGVEPTPETPYITLDTVQHGILQQYYMVYAITPMKWYKDC